MIDDDRPFVRDPARRQQRKIEGDPARIALIVTERGAGYRLAGKNRNFVLKESIARRRSLTFITPMTTRSQDEADERELLLRLLPMSASLVGLSVGAVTLFRLTDKAVRLSTFAHDLLVICAALFLLSTYLIFWALRSRKLGRARWLSKLVDGVFLTALTALVGVGFLMVYALF